VEMAAAATAVAVAVAATVAVVVAAAVVTAGKPTFTASHTRKLQTTRERRTSCGVFFCAGESLGEDGRHDVTVHVGEPKVAALVTERQPLVVDAEQVQQRRVQIVDVHR